MGPRDRPRSDLKIGKIVWVNAAQPYPPLLEIAGQGGDIPRYLSSKRARHFKNGHKVTPGATAPLGSRQNGESYLDL